MPRLRSCVGCARRVEATSLRSSRTAASKSRMSMRGTRAGPTCRRTRASHAGQVGLRSQRCAARAGACSTWTTRSARMPIAKLLQLERRPRLEVGAIGRHDLLECSCRRSLDKAIDKAATLRRRPGADLGPSPGPRGAPQSYSSSYWPHRPPALRPQESPSVPLQVHARYTRLEILAAFQHRNTREITPVANRRSMGGRRAGRTAGDHARQDEGALLADNPLPRLRD